MTKETDQHPQKSEPIKPVEPSERPATPIRKAPYPSICPVCPSKSPGTKMRFREPDDSHENLIKK